MCSDKELLEYLLELDLDSEDYVVIYESHMGGIYSSDEHEDYSNLYCETCGDSDTELISGSYVELIKTLTKELLGKVRELESIGWDIVDNINWDGVVVGNNNDNHKCGGSCISTKGQGLRDIVDNIQLAKECRICYSKEKLEELICDN